VDGSGWASKFEIRNPKEARIEGNFKWGKWKSLPSLNLQFIRAFGFPSDFDIRISAAARQGCRGVRRTPAVSRGEKRGG
jgi:hypothetical protein